MADLVPKIAVDLQAEDRVMRKKPLNKSTDYS